MKKILFTIVVLAIGIAATAQDFQGFRGLKMMESDTVIAVDVIIIDNDTFKATTQTNPLDTTLATQAYVDAGGALGVSVLGFDKETGIANISTATILVDTASFEGRWGFLTTDTLIVRNDSLLLGNDKGVPLSEVIVDSVTNEYDELTGNLSTYWYIGPTQYGPTVENLDGRDVQYSDSTDVYYTQHYLDSALAVAGEQAGFEITLPIAANLSLSVAAAVEGTNYPTEWVLAASGNDLIITHNLNRRSGAPDVYYDLLNDDNFQLSRPFTDAFQGCIMNENSVTIQTLKNYYTSYEMKITIFLVQ